MTASRGRTRESGKRKKIDADISIILAQAVLTVATGVALPIWIFKKADTTNAGITALLEVTTAIVVVIALAVLPLSIMLARIQRRMGEVASHQFEERVHLKRLHEIDNELIALQDAYTAIASSERGTVFQSVVAASVRAARQQAESCAQTKSIDVSNDLHTTQPLLNSLYAGALCRLVHYLDNNEFMVDAHSWDFFRRLAQAASTKHIGGVRRLLICNSLEEVLDPISLILATFHTDAAGYEYRLMASRHYSTLQHESGLAGGRLDIGVFGESYAYVSRQNPHLAGPLQTEPTGRIDYGRDEVVRYADFHDECWRSHLAVSYPNAAFDLVRDSVRSASGSTKSRLRTPDDVRRALEVVDDIATELNAVPSLRDQLVRLF